MNLFLTKIDVALIGKGNDVRILQKLQSIEQKLAEQNMLHKLMLNSREACLYLSISLKQLYRLTGNKLIPHYCPQGKVLYFNRLELDAWMQRNRIVTKREVRQMAKRKRKTNGRA